MTSADLNIHLSEKMTEMTSNGLTKSCRSPYRPGLLAFLVFELEGGSFWPPPPTMAKVTETATRARVKLLDINFALTNARTWPIGVQWK